MDTLVWGLLVIYVFAQGMLGYLFDSLFPFVPSGMRHLAYLSTLAVLFMFSQLPRLRRLGKPDNAYVIGSTVFVALSLARLSIAVEPYGMSKLLVVAGGGMVPGLFIFLLRRRTPQLDEAMCKWVLVLVGCEALWTLMTASASNRPGFEGLNPIWTARECAVGVILSLELRARGATRWFYIIVGATCLAGLVRTGSRGPLLALLAVLFWIGALKTRDLRRTAIAFVGLALLVTALLGSSLNVNRGNPMAAYFLRAYASPVEDPNVATRLTLFKRAFQMWVTKPLLGHGLGSFAVEITGTSGFREYPHNMVLELLSETGVIGLVMFLAALTCGFRYAHNRWTYVFAFLFLSAMTSGDIGSNMAVFPAAALAATGIRDRSHGTGSPNGQVELASSVRHAITAEGGAMRGALGLEEELVSRTTVQHNSQNGATRKSYWPGSSGCDYDKKARSRRKRQHS